MKDIAGLGRLQRNPQLWAGGVGVGGEVSDGSRLRSPSSAAGDTQTHFLQSLAWRERGSGKGRIVSLEITFAIIKLGWGGGGGRGMCVEKARTPPHPAG